MHVGENSKICVEANGVENEEGSTSQLVSIESKELHYLTTSIKADSTVDNQSIFEIYVKSG